MAQTLARNRPVLLTLLGVALLLAIMAGQFEPRVTVSILLSGLTLGALYFLVTSGLSLIFGLMDVLNFAQGLFFMLGAYAGYTLYANPRLILNTLPFALALGGGAAIGGWLARGLRGRPLPGLGEGALNGALGAVAIALLLAGVWGFNILALAAHAATASGGAISTAVAQEPDAQYAPRHALLAASGLIFGIVLGRRGASASTHRALAGGVIALGLGVALALTRTGAGEWVLSLSSDLRFVLALGAGALAGAALGGLVEWGLIRPLYARPIYQVLLTLGLVFVGTEVIKSVWGPAGFYMDTPAFFNTRAKGCPSPDILTWFSQHCASINMFGRPFPSYRLFIIALGLVMFVVITLILRRTRLGMIIRAGVQDSDMVQALGINVRRVFTLVFALGTGLAALGGVAAAPFVGVSPGLGEEFLLLAFIAVVIGGMGSYSGAAIGALLVGLARAFGDQLVLSGVHLPGVVDAVKFSPSIARASTVLLMALVLLVRPAGLFGRKE